MTRDIQPKARRTTRNAPIPAPTPARPAPVPPQRARIYVPIVPPGIDDELRAIGAITVALRTLPTRASRIEVLRFVLRRFEIEAYKLS